MSEAPEWFDGKKINEVAFCQAYLRDHPMACVNGCFFTAERRITDERELRKELYELIKPWVRSGLSKTLDGLVEVLRSEAWLEALPPQTDRIHTANGTLFLDGGFSPEKTFCRNRLPVRWDPGAPPPRHWLRFVSELLDPEDVPTLQEFLGYCLIPTTRAQKMLMLIGRGGEGKSRIGVVLRAMLGQSMVNGNLAKVETNRFARADLEHALVMVDDDLQIEALPQTNYIKTIITAELPLDLERKGRQSYQGELYCRFIAFGNGSLQALYDRSDGFFRRQIILTVRPRDRDRRDDPYLTEKLTAETEGIFLWCLAGLRRLIARDYSFTLSAGARENLRRAVCDSNNIVDFLASEGYIEWRPDASVSTRRLYAIYEQWCRDNAMNPLAMKSFSQYLAESKSKYSIEPTNNIYLKDGKRVRGFKGLCAAAQTPL